MADNHFRHRAATINVAQVWKGTITTSTAADSYTVTLTGDKGETAAIAYTVTGSEGSAAAVATAFAALWNASTNPLISSITASTNSAQVILTADTAGVPFSAVATEGGSGAWSSDANTTSCVGNTDYGTATNWETDAVPTTNDDVIVQQGSVNLLYGLNQSSVAIGAFRVEEGCRSQIGRFDNGVLHYLRIDPNSFEYRGSGQLGAFDIGSANIPVYIKALGSPSVNGLHQVYLKGSDITTAEIVKGNVGLAVMEGDTATIDTILCGWVTGQANDVQLTVGSGVTLSTAFTQTGGQAVVRCAIPTLTQSAGATLTTEGTGTITTATVRGTFYPNSTGTITTLNCWGVVDFSRDRSARTITTFNAKAGGKVILHSGITIGTFNPPADAGPFTIEYV